MTVLEYVANFTELPCFVDDYVVIDMAKVRKFEDCLKLSIRGKIVVLLLQDIDSMVRTIMATEREVDDEQNIRDMDVIKEKGKESQLLLLARGRSKRLLLRQDFKDRVVTIKAKAKDDHLQVADISGLIANQGRAHVTIAISLDT